VNINFCTLEENTLFYPSCHFDIAKATLGRKYTGFKHPLTPPQPKNKLSNNKTLIYLFFCETFKKGSIQTYYFIIQIVDRRGGSLLKPISKKR
jgi:hypothetical protein